MKALLILLALCASLHAQNVNDLIIPMRVNSNGRVANVFWRSGFTITNGVLTLNAPTVAADDVTGLDDLLDGKVSLTGSYTNPTWLVSIPFSKVTDFQTDVFKLTSATNSLSGGDIGLGWVGSRLTLQGGGGSLQWYQSGADKIMAWSGIIQAATMNLTNVSIFVAVPFSPTSAGEPGQMAFDESYFYLCVALNTWKRTALSSW